MGIEINVDEQRLAGLSSDLGIIYTKISEIKDELESLHNYMRENWKDPAVEDFSQKYETGMDRIWDLMVAVDNIETFLSAAAEGYVTADRQVESL